jgi:hypothetical protein
MNFQVRATQTDLRNGCSIEIKLSHLFPVQLRFQDACLNIKFYLILIKLAIFDS